MKKFGHLVAIFTILSLFLGIKPLKAEEIQVAVASNFTSAVKVIAQEFEKRYQHKVILAFGSTGKHYAQIKNSAPFELFLAADIQRPLLLEQEKFAVAGSRYTYARGRIVLWSPMKGFVDSNGDVLNRKDLHHIAIANPKLAPYGKAAQEVLEAKSLWSDLEGIIVRGENISQTYQYVVSGNAELGFVAYSQIIQPGKNIEGSYWEIPQSLYKPIEQQVVILKDTKPARLFWNYLKSEESKKIIQSFGYGIP